MNPKRILLKRILATASVVAGAAVVGTLASAQLQQQAASVPVTIRLHENSYTPSSGQLYESKILTWAVRSDGTSVDINERKAPDGRIVNQKIIHDLQHQQKIGVDGITQSKTTYFLSEESVKARRRRALSCSFDSTGEKEQYLGYDVVRRVRETDTPEGKIRGDAWLAPKLGCMQLKDRTTLQEAGKAPVLIQEVTAFSITPGEPEATLFEIPTSYPELSPTEVIKRYTALKGVPYNFNPEIDAGREGRYRRSRPKQ